MESFSFLKRASGPRAESDGEVSFLRAARARRSDAEPSLAPSAVPQSRGGPGPRDPSFPAQPFPPPRRRDGQRCQARSEGRCMGGTPPARRGDNTGARSRRQCSRETRAPIQLGRCDSPPPRRVTSPSFQRAGEFICNLSTNKFQRQQKFSTRRLLVGRSYRSPSYTVPFNKVLKSFICSVSR